MTVVAQSVIVLAAAQIFMYNAFEVLLAPFWVVAVVILVVGGIYLSFGFLKIYRESKRSTENPAQEQ